MGQAGRESGCKRVCVCVKERQRERGGGGKACLCFNQQIKLTLPGCTTKGLESTFTFGLVVATDLSLKCLYIIPPFFFPSDIQVMVVLLTSAG